MNSTFRRLRLHLLGWLMLAAALSYIAALLFSAYMIDGILQDPAANLLVEMGLYRWAQNNKHTLVIAFIALCMLAGVYIASAQVGSYLNQLDGALDKILSASLDPIGLPAVLRPLEMKLNTIKNTLRQREIDRKESEQRKNDLVVYLAHDLKTPLTSVIGYLALLDEEHGLPSHQREKYIQVAYRKSMKLEDLVNELFETARYNVQGMELALRPLNLPRMLRQLTEEFYPLLEEHGLSCRIESQGAGEIVADPDQLARVLDNLLRNAVFYSMAGSTVEIQSDWVPGGVRVCYRNYGVTIPPERLERIFERFYRGDEARSSGQGGAGLGLAIARRIVELHGGSITARSENLWTEFTVFLPQKENAGQENASGI